MHSILHTYIYFFQQFKFFLVSFFFYNSLQFSNALVHLNLECLILDTLVNVIIPHLFLFFLIISNKNNFRKKTNRFLFLFKNFNSSAFVECILNRYFKFDNVRIVLNFLYNKMFKVSIFLFFFVFVFYFSFCFCVMQHYEKRSSLFMFVCMYVCLCAFFEFKNVFVFVVVVLSC